MSRVIFIFTVLFFVAMAWNERKDGKERYDYWKNYYSKTKRHK